MRRRGGQLMDGYLPTHARQHAAYLFGTAASARSEGPKACCGGCVRNGRVVSNSLVKLLPRHRGHKHYHTLLFIHGLSRQAERLSPGEGLTEGYPAHHHPLPSAASRPNPPTSEHFIVFARLSVLERGRMQAEKRLHWCFPAGWHSQRRQRIRGPHPAPRRPRIATPRSIRAAPSGSAPGGSRQVKQMIKMPGLRL
jgi:hypothetical protein